MRVPNSNNNYIAINDFVISENSLTLEVGETATLTVTITPPNATNQVVEWKTDNDSVATVNETGVVQAVGVGEAYITATSVDNIEFNATCLVTVQEVQENPEDDE